MNEPDAITNRRLRHARGLARSPEIEISADFKRVFQISDVLDCQAVPSRSHSIHAIVVEALTPESHALLHAPPVMRPPTAYVAHVLDAPFKRNPARRLAIRSKRCNRRRAGDLSAPALARSRERRAARNPVGAFHVAPNAPMIGLPNFKICVCQFQSEDILIPLTAQPRLLVGNKPNAGIGQILILANLDFPRPLLAVRYVPAQYKRTRPAPFIFGIFLPNPLFFQTLYSVAVSRQRNDIDLAFLQQNHLLSANRTDWHNRRASRRRAERNRQEYRFTRHRPPPNRDEIFATKFSSRSGNL